jgi:hypothetical protein
MKKITQTLVLIFCLTTQVLGQPTNPQGDASYTFPQFNGPVINGVATPLTTDPRNTNWPSPAYSPDFKRNYFPWFSETAPNTNLNPAYEYKMQGYQNMNTIPGQLYNEIISPFSIDNATNYTNPLRFRVPLADAFTTSPDYLPEDGWELVKQDMGYFKNDNSGLAKPRTIVSEPGVSEIHSNPRALPYLMLYNKFTGNLRILGYAGHIFNETPVGRISVVLSLNDPINLSTKNFSGLLNSYGETYNPLDQETKIRRAESMTAHQGIAGFFWADFQMSYDPCVCFYESWVNVDFRKLDSYDFKAYGQSISLDEGADPSEIASYLAAVWRQEPLNSFPVENGMFNYKSGRNLEAELVASINANANYIKKDKMLKYAKLLGETMGEVGEGLGAKAKEPKTKALAKALKYGGKGIKFFASSLESPMSKATKTALALSGTVSQSSFGGITKADIATPGSWDVKNRTGEFFRDPEYPMYNESLGTVAFLTTPKVFKYENYDDSDCNFFHMIDGGEHDIAFKFDPSSLLFKFNPILDLKSYNIEVSLDFDIFNVTHSRRIGGENNVMISSEPLELYNLEVYSEKKGNDFVLGYDCIYAKRIRANSPFLSLECSGNLVSHLRINNYGTCFSSQQFLQIWGVELSVIVTGVSNKTDRNGSPITFVQKYSLPVEIIPTATRLKDLVVKNPSPYDEGGIPFDLTIGNRTFSSLFPVDKIFAHETILLNGTITNNQLQNGNRKPVSFVAGSEIELNPGFETKGFSDIILDIGSPYTQNCLPPAAVSEQSNQFVTDFCKGSIPSVKYGANQGVPRLAVDNSPSLPPIISNSKLGYPIPNPTSGECSLSFDLAEAGGYRMVITNILGEEVKHLENRNFAAAGKYTVRFQTTDLEAGVYFITLSANGFRQARKLVVVK